MYNNNIYFLLLCIWNRKNWTRLLRNGTLIESANQGTSVDHWSPQRDVQDTPGVWNTRFSCAVGKR